MELTSLAILYVIGCAGWQLFRKLKVPSPALLGSLAFIGILRAFGLDFPTTPDWLSKGTQILLGFYMALPSRKRLYVKLARFLPRSSGRHLGNLHCLYRWRHFGGVYPLDFKTGVLSASTGVLPRW